MSNPQDDMIIDPDVYNGSNKEDDSEARLKNFYPKKRQKKEEKNVKIKSEKTHLKLVEKKEITNIQYKKFSYTQKNLFQVKKIKDKNNKNNFEIKLMKKSKNEKVIEESFNKKYKEESKNNNNNISNEKSEINYDNFSHENLINPNNREFDENYNIIEMEMDKNEDLFKQEKADFISEINENKKFNSNASEEISINNQNSTIILFIGYS